MRVSNPWIWLKKNLDIPPSRRTTWMYKTTKAKCEGHQQWVFFMTWCGQLVFYLQINDVVPHSLCVIKNMSNWCIVISTLPRTWELFFKIPVMDNSLSQQRRNGNGWNECTYQLWNQKCHADSEIHLSTDLWAGHLYPTLY